MQWTALSHDVRKAAEARLGERISLCSLSILAFVVWQAWGRWHIIALVTVLHLGHLALVKLVHPKWANHRGPWTDAGIAAAHGTLTLLVAHLAGWSVAAWLLVPFDVLAGLTYEEAETRVQVLALLGAATALATWDGVPFERSACFVLLSASLFFVGQGREGVLREAFAALEHAQKLEHELQRSQKLEAIGRLAAGVAHEINTPLQYVSDSARLLGELIQAQAVYQREVDRRMSDTQARQLAAVSQEQDLPFLRAEGEQAVTRLIDGVERVATIVSALKDFAHPGQKRMAPADLNRAVFSTLEIARAEYKYVADVRLDLQPLPPVVCDIGELNQVLLNLVVNSAHAVQAVVGERGRGSIRVSTRLDGDHVVLQVADTGCGVSREVGERIFEPFFTTKEPGRGTGQGLAIARSIVRRHRGSIEFDSVVGQGTTFTVRIPRYPAAANGTDCAGGPQGVGGAAPARE